MENSHSGGNSWTNVSDDVLERSYGEEQEYGFDQLEEDLKSEGLFLDEEELEEAYSSLLEKAPITGNEIEEMLEKYSPV